MVNHRNTTAYREQMIMMMMMMLMIVMVMILMKMLMFRPHCK